MPLPSALLGALLSGSPDPKILAVFDIDDQSGLVGPNIDQLSTYLSTRLAASGIFRVIPPKELRAALEAQKKDSMSPCVDESCQIEVGKELAAQASLHSQILKIGSRCAVTSTLFDLRTAASEKAVTEKAACEVDALVDAIDRITDTLAGNSQRPPEPVQTNPTPTVDPKVDVSPPPDPKVDVPPPPPDSLGPEPPAEVSILGVGVGYGSTLGGASGAILRADLVTLDFGPFFWTLAEGGIGIIFGISGTFRETGATSDSPAFEVSDFEHQLWFLSSQFGFKLKSSTHEGRLGLGVAALRVEPDGFFDNVSYGRGEDTGGAQPAAVAAAKYLFRFLAPGAYDFPSSTIKLGAGARVVVPVDWASGTPVLVMGELVFEWSV
ncbi:MAG: hypothetical protein HY791_12360 [Deltaproteobacteria bacterium]|nr:hypothetical protein [Deltaproteobacteria bacterium]